MNIKKPVWKKGGNHTGKKGVGKASKKKGVKMDVFHLIKLVYRLEFKIS